MPRFADDAESIGGECKARMLARVPPLASIRNAEIDFERPAEAVNRGVSDH
jgi:hypothetical protein